MIERLFTLIFLFNVILIMNFVSAEKSLVFTEGPTCDLTEEKINFEMRYDGDSPIYTSNIIVEEIQAVGDGGSIVNGIRGEWSKSLLASGDRATFISDNLDKTYFGVSKRYTLYLEDAKSVWSDEVSFYCENPAQACTGQPTTCWRIKSDNTACESATYYCEHTNVYRSTCPIGSYIYSSESDCEKDLCGDNICNTPLEDCKSCPQDCGCKEDEICGEFPHCQHFINLSELEKPIEISLSFEDINHDLLIQSNGKNHYWLFDPLWKNGTQIRSYENHFDMYVGDNLKRDLENISKEGNDLSVKLLNRQGDEIKLLFSKPSKSNFSVPIPKINFNKQYLYYGGLVLIGIIIFFAGKFYLSKRKKGDKNIPTSRIEEVKSEKETKEQIPSNVTEAITVTGLGVKRGSNTILENINFSVKRGEFVSLLGPSGSGKSTIIEILAGRRKPSSGKIKIFEKDFDSEGINKYVGFVPQGNEIYLNQTVLKNLENSIIKWGIKNSEQKISNVLEQVNLTERKNLIASKLSGGQQKLLSLAMELIREPELLILDEPTTGLDPNTRNQIITLLCNLSRENKKTVLITTHFMDDSEECDEVVIINNKKIVAKGSPDKLKKMLPGSGKMVTLVLDNSDKDLLDKIKRTKGIERVIAEGRTLNILTNNPNAVEIANKVHEHGGYVNESKISKASMKEVFVFFTGRSPEE